MHRDAYLLHQVHPAKLAADFGADAVSTWLMWRRRPAAALLLAHAVAALASALLVGRDLSGLRTTKRGQYVLSHMPPSAQALRYAGQILAWHAAYRRRPAGIALGHALVAAGWSFGLLDGDRSASRARPLAADDRRPVAHGCGGARRGRGRARWGQTSRWAPTVARVPRGMIAERTMVTGIRISAPPGGCLSLQRAAP